MSWLARLYETYEQAQELSESLPQDEQLMPVSHVQQNAHINIVIDGNGNFVRAEVVEKTRIVLPATEQSAGRSSGLAPHPLADKIQYVAGDYGKFGGGKNQGYVLYEKLLRSWCESKYSQPLVKAIHSYICKMTVVADLVQHGVLHVENGLLITKWAINADPPALFKVLPKDQGLQDQSSALVCWTVEIPGSNSSKTWLDNEIRSSWIQFDSIREGYSGLCFVTGDTTVLATSHPARIRNPADRAKLISGNDLDGFTFRGRFTDSKATTKKSGYQPAGVGFIVSQKAHNALGWLIKRQHTTKGDQVFVAWAMSGHKIPDPFEDLLTVFYSQNFKPDHSLDLGLSYSKKLKKYLQGYGVGGQLKPEETIAILGVDSTSGLNGRLSVIYYRESVCQEYLNIIEKWYVDFAWFQRHELVVEENKKKPVKELNWLISAPAPYKICEATFGHLSNDSLKKNLTARLLPCIVEGKPLPVDIVNYAVKRATNRLAYKSDETWRWEQNLGIACALYKGYSKRTLHIHHQKDYAMALEETNTSRDYLYGRLLAVAEHIESYALYKAGEKRNTTAERLMQRFADRPFSTWRNLELALQPYMQRLQNISPGFLKVKKDLLDSIQSMFETSDFVSDKALSGEFLLGFHCQRLALSYKNNAVETADTEQ